MPNQYNQNSFKFTRYYFTKHSTYRTEYTYRYQQDKDLCKLQQILAPIDYTSDKSQQVEFIQ